MTFFRARAPFNGAVYAYVRVSVYVTASALKGHERAVIRANTDERSALDAIKVGRCVCREFGW